MSTERALPKGWRWVQFGDVVREVRAATRDPEADGLTRAVGLEHLDSESLPLRRSTELAGLPDGTSFTRVFRAGQVLFGKRRAYQRKVAVPNFDGVCSSDILVFEPSTDDLLPEFLPYLLQSDGFFDHALGTSAGSLSPRTKWQELARYAFALPSPACQRRIAETIESAERVGRAYDDAITNASRLEQSLVAEAQSLGTPTTMGQLASRRGIQIGPFGSQLHADEYSSEGVPVVMPSDLTPDGLRIDAIRRVPESTAARLRQHRVVVGDILLPRRGDLDKRALVTSAEVGWLCGTGSVRVRLDDPQDAELVVRLLAGAEAVHWLQSNAVGTTMPNLNADIVSRIPLVMPDRAHRSGFANRLAAIASMKSAAATARSRVALTRKVVAEWLLGGAT